MAASVDVDSEPIAADDTLEGLITDGDIRRALQRGIQVTATAADVMTRDPVTIRPEATLHEAIQAMEARACQISVLPVVQESRCLGVIRLHDIHQAGIL